MSQIIAHAVQRDLDEAFVAAVVADHDARLSPRMRHFQSYRDAYRSRFWESRNRANAAGRYQDKSEDGTIKVEVNRAYGFIEGYVGSLFNDRVSVTLKPDPTGRGNASLAEIALNNHLRAKVASKRYTAGIRQSLIYDGAGTKHGRDVKVKGALNQCWMRVIPWWELVLDYDVSDIADQRFIGHVYWMPLATAKKKYPGVEMSGSIRPDALATRRDRGTPRKPRGKTDPIQGEAINDQFVRVLEFYNLVDDYHPGEANLLTGAPRADAWEPACDPETGLAIPPLRGRYEVYLPDQARKGPIRVYPMPIDDANGRPKAPIAVLTSTTDPEYPYHGLSAMERVYDQIREMNLSRTFKANAVKRNARQVVCEENAFTTDAKELYRQGADGAMLTFTQNAEHTRTANNVVAPLRLGEIPADNYRYDEEIERDLAQGTLQAPFTRGSPVNDISATQTNVLNQYSQNEVGQLGLARDLWIAEGCAIYLRVLRQAIRSQADKSIKIVHRRKTYTLTADDLDGDFEILVKPGPTTPMAQDKDRQTFMAIMPALVKLIEQVRKGDPVAAMMLDDMVERYELDEKYLSENILRLHEEAIKKADKEPEGANPEGPDIRPGPGAGSAVPGAASAPALPEGATGDPMDRRGVPQPQPGPPSPLAGAAGPNDGGSGLVTPTA